MVVLLPLALLSVLAAIVGLFSSLKALAHRPLEWGLLVLPLLLVALMIALVADEHQETYLVDVVAAAHAAISFLLSLRWFASRRKHWSAVSPP